MAWVAGISPELGWWGIVVRMGMPQTVKERTDTSTPGTGFNGCGFRFQRLPAPPEGPGVMCTHRPAAVGERM